MRKTMIFAALAAMIVTVSCQKENLDPVNEELVFTASIVDSQTKTTINTNSEDATNRGKISWVAGDEITITDASTPAKSAVYVAASAGQTVNFTKKSGEPDLGSGPYTATYGTAPSTTQSYNDYYSDANVAKNICMTASTSSTTSKELTFTAACGLLRLNLSAASNEATKDISKIEIVGTPNGGTATIYTLNCSEAKGISSAKEFYLALPAGSYSVMKFTNSTGHICYKTAKNAVEMSNNKIQPTSISNIEFNDMLPGKFSVASGKKVRFSKGNLYYNGSAFNFEANQYDYPGSWDASHVGHFHWSKTASVAYAEVYSGSGIEADIFFTNKQTSDVTGQELPNPDFTVNDQTGVWRTLSFDEWTYLLGRSSSSLYKCEVTVCEKKTCLILAPDGFSGTIAASYDASTWPTAEAEGLVCLPAAGARYGSLIGDIGDYPLGRYWTSTPHDSDSEFARYLAFYNSASMETENTRDFGFSVRLVRE